MHNEVKGVAFIKDASYSASADLNPIFPGLDPHRGARGELGRAGERADGRGREPPRLLTSLVN